MAIVSRKVYEAAHSVRTEQYFNFYTATAAEPVLQDIKASERVHGRVLVVEQSYS